MKIGKALTAKIHQHAKEVYPKEACGFIVVAGRKQVVVPAKNVATNPFERFVIGADDVAQAEDLGEVIAVWHSHPNGSNSPSQTDIHSCNAFGVSWIIFGISKQDEEFEFTEFSFTQPSEEQLPYSGRPYVYGVYDCFTLCVDFYKKEFGIKLSFRAAGYPEIEDWGKQDVLIENYEKCGFVKASGALQVGDVMLMCVGSDVANHIGIYVGDGMLLHHCQGRLSKKDDYSASYWQKHTVMVLRHKDLVVG